MFHISKLTQQILNRQEKLSQETPEIKPFSNRAFRRLPVRKRTIATQLINYFYDKRTDTAREIYHYILYFSFQYRYVTPSQNRMGDFADVTSRTVRRILSDLKEQGLITVRNRGYNTCVYILPREIFGLRMMQILSGLFPFLKKYLLTLLFLSGRPMDSTNVLPYPQERLKLFNIYKLIVERGTLTNKRKTVNQLITALNQKISANLGLTEYAMLLNTAFDDETLQIAYDLTIKNKHKAKHIYAYFNGLCRTICEKMKKEPNYVQMYSLVIAAGFGPGCRTMLAADEDAQPRYEQPTKQVDSAQLSDKASYWLKSFKSDTILEKIKS